jgi:hypothetical protein
VDAVRGGSVAGAGALATIYRGPVNELAVAAGVDSEILLGRAMAHEIGHLLLGTNEHRPGGLMKAEWTPALLKERAPAYWVFSRDDRARLAKNLERRVNP